MPARRLAMRATFSPCSPSGIAQPRITSSTSAGSTCGTLASAALMTAAARSSGRGWRRTPFGALPTGVGTAATMTASGMTGSLSGPSGEEIRDRVGDFADVTVEQVIGGVHHDQLARFRERAVEALDGLQRAQVVALAVDEEHRLCGAAGPPPGVGP